MKPILFYDGDCGICTRIVRAIERRDTAARLCYLPLISEEYRELMSRHTWLKEVDSIVLLESGYTERISTKSTAAIRVGILLGGAWRLAAILFVIPRVIRDAAYDLIARNRHRLGDQQCQVPQR